MLSTVLSHNDFIADIIAVGYYLAIFQLLCAAKQRALTETDTPTPEFTFTFTSGCMEVVGSNLIFRGL